MDRRNFLASGLAGVAGAQSRIRVGVLRTSHSHAPAKVQILRSSPDWELVAVAEPDPQLRAKREREELYAGVRFVSEQELLGDSSIQAIAVECDPGEGIEYGPKVIRAGKHMHLEKPPSTEMKRFRAMVEEARGKKLLLQAGYIWRFHAGFDKAFEFARQGWLGEVQLFRATINTDVPDDQRRQLAQWKGGMMLELGSHPIDRLVAFWGRPKQVHNFLRHDTKSGDKLADNTLAVFEYERGMALISSTARMAHGQQHRSFELIGTDGSVVIQPIEPGAKVRLSLRTDHEQYKAGWQDVAFPPQERYVGDLRALAHSIRTGEPLKYSYDHELLVQETLLKACGMWA
jgi:predicted dehydrogenase